MKNLIGTVFTLCLLLSGLRVQAQENVVKLRIGQLAAGKVELMYERVVADNQSLVVSLGVNIPRNSVPTSFTSDTLFTNSEGSTSFNGFSITPEYRFYLGAEGAPYKFYIGPYLRYRRWGYDIESNVTYEDNGNLEDVNVALSGSWSGVGGGVGIGVQWLINDVFAIDWNIIGLGVTYQTIKFKGTADDPSTNWAEVVTELNNTFAEAPVLGTQFEAVEEGAGLSGKFGFILPSLRTNVCLGIAF